MFAREELDGQDDYEQQAAKDEGEAGDEGKLTALIDPLPDLTFGGEARGRTSYQFTTHRCIG